MKLLKSIIISALISSLLIQGCYSHPEISRLETIKENNFDDSNIVVYLKDGNEINSKAGQHHFINSPSDFYFGEMEKSSSHYIPGTVVIKSSDVISDSTYSINGKEYCQLRFNNYGSLTISQQNFEKIKSIYAGEYINIGNGSMEILFNKNEILLFDKEKLFKVKKQDGEGLRCKGTLVDEEKSDPYDGVINFNQISNFELKKDTGISAFLITAVVLLGALVIIGLSNFHFGKTYSY